MDRSSRGRVRLPDRREQPLGETEAVVATVDHGELVAAQARHLQAARGRLEAVADRRQEAVADGVAEGVVHVLEPVDVDQVHAHRCAGGDGVRQAPQQAGAVQEARQIVVLGLERDPLQQAAVLAERHPLPRDEERCDQEQHRELRAVHAPVDEPDPGGGHQSRADGQVEQKLQAPVGWTPPCPPLDVHGWNAARKRRQREQGVCGCPADVDQRVAVAREPAEGVRREAHVRGRAHGGARCEERDQRAARGRAPEHRADGCEDDGVGDRQRQRREHRGQAAVRVCHRRLDERPPGDEEGRARHQQAVEGEPQPASGRRGRPRQREDSRPGRGSTPPA